MSANVWPVDAISNVPDYTGRMLRQLVGLFWARNPARPLGARSGVVAGTPKTIATVSGSTWTVTPFGGVVDGESSAIAGAYNFSFDSNQTGSVNAAHATLDRVDLLYVRVSDPAEGDGSSVPVIELLYLAGTAASTPSAPATPARSIPVATILVPKATPGGPSVVSWAASAAVAAGGTTPLLTPAATPSSPYDGQLVTDPINGLRRYSAAEASWNSGLTLIWQAHDASSLVTLPDSVLTNLTLDTIDIDTAGVGVSGGVFTAPTDGRYWVSGVVRFPSNATGARSAAAALNGSATGASHTLYQTTSLSHSSFVGLATSVIECSAGDTISLQGFQDTGGGTLTVVAGSSLTVVRL